MKRQYIESMNHVYNGHGRLVRKNRTYLGYRINDEFSTYQNYNDRNGKIGYWHIIHNRTGYSIGMVKNRSDIKTVLERFDTQLMNYAYTTESGFLEWRSSTARYTLREQWQEMKNSGILA